MAHVFPPYPGIKSKERIAYERSVAELYDAMLERIGNDLRSNLSGRDSDDVRDGNKPDKG